MTLPDAVADFIAGGADGEVTLRANEAAFERLCLLPRVLRGDAPRDLHTTLLGCELALPVLAAPTAFHKLVHPDGEVATAGAVATAGTVMVVSMASTVAIGDIAAAVPDATLWFQLYLQPDRGFTADLVKRAEAAGCAAIVLTVDAPVFGRRERDLRHGFTDLPGGMCCENLRDPATGQPRRIEFAPLSWSDVDWLRSRTALPIVLKGMTHPADAALAAYNGVDALVVSNHGGRQLDTMPAAIDLLPPVVAAVHGQLPVLLDGGVRRGTDVLKALALGATAVAIGRPVLWGLAARRLDAVFAQFAEELDRALALCGLASPADARPELVTRC